MIPTSIDGTDITGATIDGTDVTEITVDGQTVFSVSSDLVARYRFEQNVNDNFASNDGVDNTGAGYTTDAFEGSFAKVFNASGAVEIPNFPNFDANFSITFAIKSSSSADELIWQSDSNRTAFPSNSVVFANFGTQLGIYPYNAQGNGSPFHGIIPSSNVRTGSYEIVTITSSGTENNADLNGYLNGSLVNTVTDVTTINPTQSHRVYIGEGFDGFAPFTASGFDDLRFHNRTLTASEVSNLHNTGSI